jgi:hypothetical protein
MIVRGNIITKGFRGRLGNLIYRQIGDNTFVNPAPDYSKYKWSKAQKENRKRFREAMAFARTVLQDPVKVKYYRRKAKGLQTAWNVAVSEYLKNLKAKELKGKKTSRP